MAEDGSPAPISSLYWSTRTPIHKGTYATWQSPRTSRTLAVESRMLAQARP